MVKDAALPHHCPHQGLNGGWQSDKDYLERRKMITNIVNLLQRRKPNAPQAWLDRLPQMAKRLEVCLYRSAKTLDEYRDESTLKRRLQQLAINIGIHVDKNKLRQEQQQQQQQEEHHQEALPHELQGTLPAAIATREEEERYQDEDDDDAAAAVLKQRLRNFVFRPIEQPDEEMRQEHEG